MSLARNKKKRYIYRLCVSAYKCTPNAFFRYTEHGIEHTKEFCLYQKGTLRQTISVHCFQATG